MSWTTDQYVTAAAVFLLVLSVPLTFQIADARAGRAGQPTADHTQTTVAKATSGQTTNDGDGDGVPDSTDRCPKQPETQNGYRDGDGCPDTVATTSAS